MKNIFKFLGVAILATTLVVACGNDPEEEPGNGGNNGGNVNPQPPTPPTPDTPDPGTLQISWADSTFAPQAATFKYISADTIENRVGLAQFYFRNKGYTPLINMYYHTTPNEAGYVYVGKAYGQEVQHGAAFDQIDTTARYYYSNMGICKLQLAGNQIIARGGSLVYCDWWLKSGRLGVTAFDPTFNQFSYELNATMFNFRQFYDKLVLNQPWWVDSCDSAILRITATNYMFELEE